ncbi:hypothetical protein MF628_001285 [Paenibacillus polymyxa]|uniref:hypothetical protein n=1 Tax=Paenibacillus polymyxa TaxID=1406 RepID=UPI002023E247|nr:hypothetical protein [Paenibacillus polymyxa]URJ46720.1 hypothetical protein MF628_001285 [Paenibacillus polymyxa]
MIVLNDELTTRYGLDLILRSLLDRDSLDYIKSYIGLNPDPKANAPLLQIQIHPCATQKCIMSIIPFIAKGTTGHY